MALTRTDVVAGYTAEIRAFEELIRSLDETQWSAPSRCAGWRVSEVAAHVTGALTTIAAGRLDEFADPDHVDRHVSERAGLSKDEMADEYAKAADIAGQLMAALDDEGWGAPAGSVAPTLGQGVETLWYDTYVHIDDINNALGKPSDRGAGLRLSARHLAEILTDRGWGPATLALDGLEEIPVSGGGDRVTGDPLAFVLAATGRADPSLVGLDETVNVYR